MKIEVNPTSLRNLESICEVLYKLHPYVLDYLVDMQRSLGDVLGLVNLSNTSLEQRDKLNLIFKPEDEEDASNNVMKIRPANVEQLKKDEEAERPCAITKFLKLDTDEYIPMKVFVEIEDPVVGRKVKELVETLEKTGAPEQFYLNKQELDEYAYFAEGYGLSMSKEQRKKQKEFYKTDKLALWMFLMKEKLY